jgi:hypothetical protein
VPARPIFQGDIFEGVPHVKIQAGDRPEADPKFLVERRLVMALTYPCEMYTQGALARVQSIAVVREGEKLRVPTDWRGAFSVCPLPDPFGDGRLWTVDFRATGTVDRSYLLPEKRRACLSELGWAYLRQRLATYHTRVAIHLDDLQRTGEATWTEMELWEQWNTLGLPSDQYQPWLDAFNPGIGFTHRQALERGMRRLVGSALLSRAG